MRNFWNKKHSQNDIASLSGHPGNTVIKGLYAEHLINPGMDVLEIGVGLGICTRDLAAAGMRVQCVDISDVALLRVSDCTVARYLADAMDRIPSNLFDLAISYCVTQHINNASLAEHLKHAIRSLKPTGTFAMQYAIPFHSVGYDESGPSMESGSVRRPLEMMCEMIHAAGGRITLHRIWGVFPQYKSGWAIVHIMRKESE